MKVLDLFSGLGGWSQAFKDRGHSVVTVDFEAKFNPTLCGDIQNLKREDFDKYGKFDIILASPPCNCFSMMSVYRHWKDHKPNPETVVAIALVKKTLTLIRSLNPRWWILENPMGMLRTVIGKPEATITLCQYGERRMKPTDLWGKFPSTFIPKKCRNGALCHERTPRGSHKGTQGLKTPEERAKMPYNLSLELCLACERNISTKDVLIEQTLLEAME